MHVSTFGGGETGCAAAIAVPGLLDDALLEHVHDLAALFRSRLAAHRFGLRGRVLAMALTADDPTLRARRSR